MNGRQWFPFVSVLSQSFSKIFDKAFLSRALTARWSTDRWIILGCNPITLDSLFSYHASKCQLTHRHWSSCVLSLHCRWSMRYPSPPHICDASLPRETFTDSIIHDRNIWRPNRDLLVLGTVAYQVLATQWHSGRWEGQGAMMRQISRRMVEMEKHLFSDMKRNLYLNSSPVSPYRASCTCLGQLNEILLLLTGNEVLSSFREWFGP